MYDMCERLPVWRRVRVLAAVAASAATLLAGCGQTPEGALARDIAIGYDRSAVELRQGEAVQLRLNLTCARATGVSFGFESTVSLSHQILPGSGGLQVDAPAAIDCSTPQPSGIFTGSVLLRLSADARATPGPRRLQTRATLTTSPLQPEFGFSAIDVQVIADGAPRRAADFAATGQVLAVALAWTADPADPNPPESHRLERFGANGQFDALVTLPAGTLAYTDTGLQPDTAYTYRLVPINRHGEGPASTTSARTPVGSGPRQFALQLDVDGSAPGRVVSQPAGLDCPGACRAEFVEGSTVSLTATPPVGGVVNWSGSAACSGSGWIVNVPITAATFCRATFAAAPPTVPPGWTSAGTVRTVPALLGAPAIAFDANGEPTVAYVEQGGGTERGALRVVRRRAGLWLLVSADPVNAGGPAAMASPALVLLDNGEPVVAWTNADGEMRISAWIGSGWVALGGGNLATAGSLTRASLPQLERNDTRLVAAWTETTSGGARLVVKRAPLTDLVLAWSGGLVPGTTSGGSVQARLALDAGGNASLLVLTTAINGLESPLRVLEETTGWQAACGSLGSSGGVANSTIGFAIQRDRRRDGSAVVLRPSADYRQVLGARCVNGSWQPLGLAANGVVAEVDNIGRVLSQLTLIPERGGRGPVALVAIDEGYRGATSYVQATLGDAGFEAAPGLERPRFAVPRTLGAAAIGAGAIGFVQGFQGAGQVDVDVWRFAP